MEQFFQLTLEFISHVFKGDLEYVTQMIREYSTLFYAIFFLIIFVETGLIVMPILPGDSLLFMIGAAIAATGALKLEITIPLLILAALLGDNVNYFVGKFFGKQIKSREKILFFKRKYLEDTEAFYAKHGGKTVIMARFVPIVRTIAPFVAGAGSMPYARYILFCVLGAVLWVGGITIVGYYFGTVPFVKNNLEKVLVGIIFVSVLPIIWQFAKSRMAVKKA